MSKCPEGREFMLYPLGGEDLWGTLSIVMYHLLKQFYRTLNLNVNDKVEGYRRSEFWKRNLYSFTES